MSRQPNIFCFSIFSSDKATPTEEHLFPVSVIDVWEARQREREERERREERGRGERREGEKRGREERERREGEEREREERGS